MTEQGNGVSPPAAPAQPDPAVVEALVKDISAQLSQLVQLLALQVKPEDLAQIVVLLVNEQFTVTRQILPSFTDPSRVEKFPQLGMRLQMEHSGILGLKASKKIPVQIGLAPVPIRPDRPANPAFRAERLSDASMQAIIFSMLLNPVMRGLLRVYGIGYDFVEHKAQSMILSPHGRKI